MGRKKDDEERKRKGKDPAPPPAKKHKQIPFVDPNSDEFRARATLNISRPPTGPRSGAPNPRVNPDEVPYEQRFVNNRAREEFEGNLKERKLLIERGMDLTQCKELVTKLLKRKCHKLLGIPDRDLNLTLTREFYANFAESNLRHESVTVRGIDVPFNADEINKHYGLGKCKGDDYEAVYQKLVAQGEDPLEDLRIAIKPSLPWGMTKFGEGRQELLTESWPEEWRLLAKFIQLRVLPKTNLSHFKIEDLKIGYAIWKNLCVNVGQSIYREFTQRRKVKNRCLITPYLVQDLCLKAGVKEYAGDEKLRVKSKDLAPDKKNLALEKATPPPTTTTTTTTSIPTSTSMPSSSSRPAVTTTTTTTTRAPTLIESPVSPLTARESLYIAHNQRDWMDSLRVSLNSLMAGVQELAELQGHKLKTELKQDDSPFHYDKAVEKRLEKIALEDIVADSTDSGTDSGTDTDGDDDGDDVREEDVVEEDSDSDEVVVVEPRVAIAGSGAQDDQDSGAAESDPDVDATDAADPALEFLGNVSDFLDVTALDARSPGGGSMNA